MAYWWVNQGETAEFSVGYMWAPKLGKTGQAIWHWTPMRDVRPGDIIFNYATKQLIAVSRARSSAQSHVRPSAWPESTSAWGDDGLIVHLDQEPLESPVSIESLHAAGLAIPGTGPFDKNGRVQQAYLFALTNEAGDSLWQLIGDARSKPQLIERGESRSRDMPYLADAHFEGELDRPNATPVRGEQAHLRRYLFGNSTEDVCDLCGRTLPVELLRASHIVRRAELTASERRKFDSIAFRTCILGCDSLFETGHIAVEGGAITKGRPSLNRAIREYVNPLIGRYCIAADEKRKPYFDRHYRTATLQGHNTVP